MSGKSLSSYNVIVRILKLAVLSIALPVMGALDV